MTLQQQPQFNRHTGLDPVSLWFRRESIIANTDEIPGQARNDNLWVKPGMTVFFAGADGGMAL